MEVKRKWHEEIAVPTLFYGAETCEVRVEGKRMLNVLEM